MVHEMVEMGVDASAGAFVMDFTTTGDKGRWAPGLRPYVVRGVGIALNAAPGDAGVIKFDKRITYGSDTGRGDGDVAVVNLATAHPAGKVIYKMGLNVEIKPGEEIVVEATDASALVSAARVVLFLEPRPEAPANLSGMTAST